LMVLLYQRREDSRIAAFLLATTTSQAICPSLADDAVARFTRSRLLPEPRARSRLICWRR